MDKKLLDIVCCPQTKLPLQMLAGDRLTRLNDAIRRGAIRNHGDRVLASVVAEALVTRNGRLAYPVRDGIPILLEEEAIDLQQVTD
jgi:uncharacterized protein